MGLKRLVCTMYTPNEISLAIIVRVPCLQVRAAEAGVRGGLLRSHPQDRRPRWQCWTAWHCHDNTSSPQEEEGP